MLTRIWERLPFVEGTAKRAYLDASPLPYKLDERVGGNATPRVEAKTSTPKSEPIPHEQVLARIRAERDALAGRLKRLETMLADPEKGQNAILYFRLRAIWDLCNRDLMALSRQFREKYVSVSGNDAAPAEDAQSARLRAVQARVRALEAEARQHGYDLNKREKPFKVGEKQALTHALEKTRKELEAAMRELKALKSTQAPQSAAPLTGSTAGKEVLTTQTKRAINTTLIALAQHFYLAYREEQIAEMALRASQKPVDEVNFGLASECLQLGNTIRDLAGRVKNETNRHEVVRKRVEYLKNKLRYKSDNDAIPEMHSLNSMPTRVASQEGLFANLGDEIPVNVLALNYWNIKKALLK